jgi:YggT family protein
LRFVYQMTEPIMAPVRNVMPSMGGLDLSPIIVLFGIDILRRILISALV